MLRKAMKLQAVLLLLCFSMLGACAGASSGPPERQPYLVTTPHEVGGVRLNGFHCLDGACPTGAPVANPLIVREIYALSANRETKFADWVAYVVNASTIGRSQTRTWAADPWLDPAETLEPQDYTGANAALGTDRGHQAPLAALSGTPHWADTNYLSNITPQMAPLNQGPWERLEARERALAGGGAQLYVLTGPLYERDMPSLPGADEPHTLPSGYWKVIASEGAASAFIMDQQTPRDSAYCTHLVSIAEVEARSGLRLYPRRQTGFEPLDRQLGCADS